MRSPFIAAWLDSHGLEVEVEELLVAHLDAVFPGGSVDGLTGGICRRDRLGGLLHEYSSGEASARSSKGSRKQPSWVRQATATRPSYSRASTHPR